MHPPLDPRPLQEHPDADAVLGAFLDHLAATGTEPYPHQEQAILEVFAGHNVILDTPTGSGKSLVALAMQFRALCLGRRSFYTVPVKALANEKFLALCRLFGAEHVGMLTGDATVNRDAPVVCCTAEILANIALRHGAEAPVDDVIMDEFHYYSDADRGAAWQIPLLALPRARFLLMSATLGDPSRFIEKLAALTGAPAVRVWSDERPVPLEFAYSTDPLEEKVAALAEQGRAPVYLVHFSQRACAESANNLMSTNFSTREEKTAIARTLDGADFRSPYGRELSRLLRHGIGVHHAGLLPKYRLLVEKLTAAGLLKVVCGTDTLGVGVNVPIRTVMLTGLCKYDGRGTRILAARDFHQIVGRAGRRGFDTTGHVVAQAPEHVIENLRAEARADAKGRKSFQKRKPPEKGYVHWDEATFERLRAAPPEPLVSRFSIHPSSLINTLAREGEDGCRALRRLIADCDEPPKSKRRLRKRAFALFRGLLAADILRVIPPHRRTGPRKVEVAEGLPADFSIHHALAIYLLDAIPRLDRTDPSYALNVVSLVEAVLEDPAPVLRRQVDARRAELLARLRDEGVPFEQRVEMLEEVTWPKPGADFIYSTFNEFRLRHPYLDGESVRPKCVAREMLENLTSFEDYIKTYKLERTEAVLLRHLAEVHRMLDRTVPESFKDEALLAAESFLELIVRRTDSSLLDEWHTLRDGAPPPLHEAAATPPPPLLQQPYSRSGSSFSRDLRNHVQTILTALSRGDAASILTLVEPDDNDGAPWTPARLQRVLDAYRDARGRIRLDPEARNARHTHFDGDGVTLHQTLLDSDDMNDWAATFTLDLAKSDATRTPVLRLGSISPVVD